MGRSRWCGSHSTSNKLKNKEPEEKKEVDNDLRGSPSQPQYCLGALTIPLKLWKTEKLKHIFKVIFKNDWKYFLLHINTEWNKSRGGLAVLINFNKYHSLSKEDLMWTMSIGILTIIHCLVLFLFQPSGSLIKWSNIYFLTYLCVITAVAEGIYIRSVLHTKYKSNWVSYK